MKAKILQQLMLYSYRYIFAYISIVVISLYFLFWQVSSVAPGLSGIELDLAATHTNAKASLLVSMYPLFTKLQIFSLKVFGVSAWSIRVPHILIAGATLILLYQILKRWFGKPTSLLSVALIATADWFLFIARHATGAIELSFWLALCILSIIKLVERKTIWFIPFITSLTCLLFVPFGVYIAFTILVSCLTSQVLRDRLFNVSLVNKVIGGVIPLVSISFLIFAVTREPSIGKQLLGFSEILPLTPVDYIKNAIISSSSIVAVLPANNPITGPSGVFFVRFFELTFVLFGIFMFYKTRINRLNVIILSIALVSILVSGFSNDSASRGLLIVPFAIFITVGMRYFMHRWQKTFPRNPYARMAAIIPVVLLVALTAFIHYQSYFVLWPRQTATVNSFSHQLHNALQQLNNTSSNNCVIMTRNNSLSTLIKEGGTTCSPSFENTLLPPPTTNELQLIDPVLIDSKATKPWFKQRALTSPNSETSILWIVSGQQL